jgi:hypothetical protein
MPNGISNRQKRDELRHQKRMRAAMAAPLAGKVPPKAIPVPTAVKRPPAGLAPSQHYPLKRAAVGKRQEVKP